MFLPDKPGIASHARHTAAVNRGLWLGQFRDRHFAHMAFGSTPTLQCIRVVVSDRQRSSIAQSHTCSRQKRARHGQAANGAGAILQESSEI